VIKGCNIFWGQKLANTGSFVGGRIIVQQEIISRAECSWTNLLNALQEAIHYSFINFCIYSFSLWYEFFVHYALRVEKKLSTWFWFGIVGISVSSAEGMSHQPIQTLSLCFGVMGKTPGLISSNNFVKKFLFASAIAMSWEDVTRSSLCSEVKKCGTKRAYNFLFPKSSFRIQRTTVLGMVKDFAIILDAIWQSFLTKSATAATFTSVWVNFVRPPLSSSSTSYLPSRNREYHLKSLIGSEPHSHKPFALILVFLSHIDRLWSKILWQLVFISAIHDV